MGVGGGVAASSHLVVVRWYRFQHWIVILHFLCPDWPDIRCPTVRPLFCHVACSTAQVDGDAGCVWSLPRRILRAKMLAAQRERDQALRTAVTSLNSDPRFAGWTWTVMPNELGVLRICGLITLTFPRVSLGPAAAAAGGAGGAAVAPGTLPMAVPVNNISAYPGGVAMQQLQQQQQQQQQQQPGFAVPQAYPAASVVGYAAGPAPGVGVGGGVGGGMPAAYSGAGGAPPSYSYTSSTATATGAVGYAPAQPGTAAAPPVTSEPPASATAPIGYSPGGVGVGYNPTAPAVAATPGYNPTPYNAGGASDLPPASNNGKPSAGGPGVLL